MELTDAVSVYRTEISRDPVRSVTAVTYETGCNVARRYTSVDFGRLCAEYNSSGSSDVIVTFSGGRIRPGGCKIGFEYDTRQPLTWREQFDQLRGSCPARGMFSFSI